MRIHKLKLKFLNVQRVFSFSGINEQSLDGKKKKRTESGTVKCWLLHIIVSWGQLMWSTTALLNYFTVVCHRNWCGTVLFFFVKFYYYIKIWLTYTHRLWVVLTKRRAFNHFSNEYLINVKHHLAVALFMAWEHLHNFMKSTE